MTPDEVTIEDSAEVGTTVPDVQPQPAQPAPQPPVVPTAPPQVMGCPGDCNRCTPLHRGYCASQIAYNMQNAIARIEGAVSLLSQAVAGIETRVANIEEQLAAKERDEKQQPDFVAPEPEKPKRGRGGKLRSLQE